MVERKGMFKGKRWYKKGKGRNAKTGQKVQWSKES